MNEDELIEFENELLGTPCLARKAGQGLAAEVRRLHAEVAALHVEIAALRAPASASIGTLLAAGEVWCSGMPNRNPGRCSVCGTFTWVGITHSRRVR